MNERIRELALQAGFAHEPTKDQLWVGGPTEIMISPGLEKFAELIVRECALTLESITVPVFESVEDFDNGYNKALLTGSTVIKKHFGVSE